MSLEKQQNLLARLYTDSDLRRDFLTEPEKVGRRFDLTENEIFELAAVLPDELIFFAETLFFKRLREVEKLLPRTRKTLSARFETHFRAFSKTFLPTTIKKHLEDAVKFADFLCKRELEPIWIADLIRYEQANLIFHGYGKSFLFRMFKFNVRDFSRLLDKPQRKPTIAVWLKIGGKDRHFIF